MVVVGLTGGVASGKSFVAQCFEELGAARIDADQVAHGVLQDPSVIQQIVDQWGAELLDEDGQIQRGQLAKVVFAGTDESNLDRLESIVHPEIRLRIQREMDSVRVAGKTELLVLDIPLLFEGNYHTQCDHVIFVDANLSAREKRAKLRGWADGELAKRELRQLPIEEKKLRSDVVIDNSDSRKSTAMQLADFCKDHSLGDVSLLDDLDLKFTENRDSKIDPT